MLSKKLEIYTPLPYTFNVKNTVPKRLLEIPYDQNLKFASFDITTIHMNELIKITGLTCDQHDKEELKHGIR